MGGASSYVNEWLLLLVGICRDATGHYTDTQNHGSEETKALVKKI